MRSGAPSSAEHAQHVVVGVAVVDLQHLAEPLGEVDVPAERPVLGGAPGDVVGVHPVVVEPGLADHPDPRVTGQLLDLGEGGGQPRVAAARPAIAAGLVRVQRDPAEQPSGSPAARARSRRSSSIATVQRAASRSHPICTMRVTLTAAARGERVVDAERGLAAARVVEVGVVVDDGPRQRLRHGGVRSVAHRAPHRS